MTISELFNAHFAVIHDETKNAELAKLFYEKDITTVCLGVVRDGDDWRWIENGTVCRKNKYYLSSERKNSKLI